MAKQPQEPQDDSKFVPAGLKWLAEMESLNSPALLNILYGNIYSFPYVKDAEILIDRHNHKMLIWIEFSWTIRKILTNRKKSTIISLLDQLQELLPSFTFRVIEDKDLFDLAVRRMKENLFGEKNQEPDPKAAANGDPVTVQDSNTSDPTPGSDSSTSEVVIPDQKEQSES